MTLDLSSVPAVAGEGAMRIRDILRRSHGAFREDWLTDKFRYDARRANEIAKAMEKAGYVQRDEEREHENNSLFPWYSVTDAGREIIRASAAIRIKKETAAAQLTEFMKRVHMVNASPKYLYSVKRVAVFGSFLGRRERLGDVDVAVDLKSRVPIDKNHEWLEHFRQHAWESGRCFSTWDDEVDWPRREVLLMLKSSKRCISIQSWFSFIEMEKTRSFRYQVLCGDATEIRRELARSRRERRLQDDSS
jgi:predicted nucleotidyltransferase